MSPRVLLICHGEAPLHWDGFARWLATWATVAGIVVIDEPRSRTWQRLKRERRRVGLARLLDVLAFRLYYRLALARRDQRWTRQLLHQLRNRYAPMPADVPVFRTRTPNSPEAEHFSRCVAPDLTIALCKNLLKESVFSIPPIGTFVLHPGICPEYRNAHGCFWALTRGDHDRVGMSLLRIDRGIDTGPVFGYFGCDYDEVTDSHIVIQHRVVFDNLEAIRDKLREVVAGTAQPVCTTGRKSGEWGQPWLSEYWSWKAKARQRTRALRHA